jgi:hypothetical protein
MAKKHKHEEHVNHERWLVSYADMMTLLFALFVVLYAMGQSELAKKEFAESVRWAFHISGDGKTKDTGIFDDQKGGGDVLAPAQLVTAQNGAMREFLKDQLVKYEEVAGKSLDIIQTDGTIAFTAPVGDFFDPERPYPVRREVGGWLEQTLSASLGFASSIQIRIRAPELPIGKDRRGKVMTSRDLTVERLRTMERKVRTLPEVRSGMVECTWMLMEDEPDVSPHTWEERSTITVSFTNEPR